MGAHSEHTTLPGYHEDQLLHDGCDECEYRGENPALAINNLDSARFMQAWERAGTKQLHGLRSASRAELPMLDALAAVQVQLERVGWQIGLMPRPRR